MKLVEEFREYRPVEADLPRPPIEVDTEARLNKREHGGAGPSLRRARDGIKCRRIEPPPREPAKQLRQPPQIHMARGLEQPSEDLEDFSLQAIAGQPQRVQRAMALGQRGPPLRRAASLVKERFVSIIPTLVDQAGIILAVILDETVAVLTAIPIDPLQRHLHIGTHSAARREMPGALQVF